MTDPTDPRNELLARAVDSIMRGMSDAFDRVWQRPDAAALVAAFLGDRVVFQIDRLGVTIAERPDETGTGDTLSPAPAADRPAADPPDPPPSTGHYL
jgi:hypothetical protein